MAVADAATGAAFVVVGLRTQDAFRRQKNISGSVVTRVERARASAGYRNSLPKSRKRKLRKPVER